MSINKKVIYKGIECTLLESYLTDDSGPCVKIIRSKDIDKAYH